LEIGAGGKVSENLRKTKGKVILKLKWNLQGKFEKIFIAKSSIKPPGNNKLPRFNQSPIQTFTHYRSFRVQLSSVSFIPAFLSSDATVALNCETNK
jgi:hypothetical protein